ncbi:hypothetical protein LR69_01436 [Geobacillus sp. BCO2]|nr:hypothetical protein LR69_01436 [Geobacillus sp. BCO2]
MALLLMGYSLVTQLFPSFVLSLMKQNFVTKQGAFAGILAGVATVAYIHLSGSSVGTMFPSLPQAVQDLNVGIVALIVNTVVTVVVSWIPFGPVTVKEGKRAM